MAAPVNERLIILNHLVSRSSSHAGQEHAPPIHGAEELLRILDMRRSRGEAIEYLGATDHEDEKIRKENGFRHDFVRLKHFNITQGEFCKYAVMLFEHADQTQKTFPVIHRRNLAGRELSGDEEEVGASTAHVVVRLPNDGDYDDGSYRCAIEHVHSGVSRKLISTLMRRQLRRHARNEIWTFEKFIKNKKGKPEIKKYRYSPKLDLLADVARALADGTASAKVLTSMTFTKRSERRATGRETSVKHAEYEADVAIKVAMTQAPKDSTERRTWVQRIRDEFDQLGYTSQLYYRSAGGSEMRGKVHQDVEGAADLLLCPKEIISLSSPARRWRDDMCDEMVAALRELVDRDELWTRVG
ncbi:hypothetical protein Q8W71_07350 [Methylobacterium sp. NEAU 140]|uniref:hypothetical protein n=1 Tax=Methylobacterium sp. NEAU 140 TaxID=3064945 RepID=UPI002733F89B|nr:hypothetical protein [Methylobacterium sp. NEAU 140]MDP4022433.1 hypothetical protein [Methylobacterium sp. NEAU 140]